MSKNLERAVEVEVKRVNDVCIANIISNKGKCAGIIPSTILSDNELVGALVNIHRMDCPAEFEDDYYDRCAKHNIDIEEKWPLEPICSSDIAATKKATKLGIVDGYYNFKNYDKKITVSNRDLRDALDEIEEDGPVACTKHNHKILNLLGLTDTNLDKLYVKGE